MSKPSSVRIKKKLIHYLFYVLFLSWTQCRLALSWPGCKTEEPHVLKMGPLGDIDVISPSTRASGIFHFPLLSLVLGAKVCPLGTYFFNWNKGISYLSTIGAEPGKWLHFGKKYITTSDASLFMYCALKSRFRELVFTYFLCATIPTKIRFVIASDANCTS